MRWVLLSWCVVWLTLTVGCGLTLDPLPPVTQTDEDAGVASGCERDRDCPACESCRDGTCQDLVGGPCLKECETGLWSCDGTDTFCDTDGVARAGVVCSRERGLCRPEATCDGVSNDCPDTQREDGYDCGDQRVCQDGQCVREDCIADLPCDPPDLPCAEGLTVCDDESVECAVVGVKAAGDSCRQAAGVCDLEETCDGISGYCPADRVAAGGTQCRASDGLCGAAEQCDGVQVDCPPDTSAPAGTLCQGDTGTCDGSGMCLGCVEGRPCSTGNPCQEGLTECLGEVVVCLPNGPKPAGTICRAASGLCDVAEECSGSSDMCPADDLLPGGVVCRAEVDVCDAPELCSGVSAACPLDVVAPAGRECRGSGPDDCDATEFCDGVSTGCGPDGYQPLGAPCGSMGGLCDGMGMCQKDCGAPCTIGGICNAGILDCTTGSPVCNPMPSSPTTLCRASSGPCDIEEYCDGTNRVCPDDELEPAGVVCQMGATVCEPSSSCTGAAPSCPMVAPLPDGAPCTLPVIPNPCGIYTCMNGACIWDQSMSPEGECGLGNLCCPSGTCAAGTFCALDPF